MASKGCRLEKGGGGVKGLKGRHSFAWMFFFRGVEDNICTRFFGRSKKGP